MKTELQKSVTKWSKIILLKRILWTYVLEPMVRWLPKAASPARILLLRLMGAKIGANCLILSGVKVLMPWNLHMKDFVALGANVNVYNFANVLIESMTVVSQDVFICTGSHDYQLSHMPLIYKPISIGSECWIAAGVFLGPGVNVPNGAVVGAMSVVSKSLDEEWFVYAGNPCRKIRKRVMRETEA
jgi:putative colanic acid biosynthesis acetyltransferase WcaF